MHKLQEVTASQLVDGKMQFLVHGSTVVQTQRFRALQFHYEADGESKM
eukprot:SAG31_NODE_3663_length_4010_cov_4.327330_1_plen_48_part_00